MLINIAGKSHTGRTREAIKLLTPNTDTLAFSTDGDIVDRVRESFVTSKERFDVLKGFSVINSSDQNLMINILKQSITDTKFDNLIFDSLSMFTIKQREEISEIITQASMDHPNKKFIVVSSQFKG